MNRPLTFLLSTAAAVAAMAASALGASSFGPLKACATFTGPAWKVTSNGGPVTRGKVYEVDIDRAPCALAKTWAMKFVRTPTHGDYRLRGPAGWTCRANFGVSEIWAQNGRCDKGTTQAFAWGP